MYYAAALLYIDSTFSGHVVQGTSNVYYFWEVSRWHIWGYSCLDDIAEQYKSKIPPGVKPFREPPFQKGAGFSYEPNYLCHNFRVNNYFLFNLYCPQIIIPIVA